MEASILYRVVLFVLKNYSSRVGLRFETFLVFASIIIYMTMANIKCSQINKVSKLLRAPYSIPSKYEKSETLSKGYTHMIKRDIIKPVHRGMHVLMPLGFRVLDKLTKLLDREMLNIGAQKLLLPALTPTDLWKKTNRYESNKSELFQIRDRYNTNYILSPTDEEEICNLLHELQPIKQEQLPLKVYQISNKWRDEMRPRLGLLRSREFIMKDLYTFDADLNNAKNTYNLVCAAYNNIFDQLGIKYIKAIGDTGFTGGSLSHEYHFLCNIGEDVVLSCSSCNYHKNEKVHTSTECPDCNKPLEKHNAIEVGHTFLLDTKYSEPLKALYTNQNTKIPLVMGCYGIGVTRIMAAIAEILSTDKHLRWPANLAPYTVFIIPPEVGSKEEQEAVPYLERLCETLSRLGLDAIIDDRTYLSIGKRLNYARATGFPYAIILGKAVMLKSKYEICDIYNENTEDIALEDMDDYFKDRFIIII